MHTGLTWENEGKGKCRVRRVMQERDIWGIFANADCEIQSFVDTSDCGGVGLWNAMTIDRTEAQDLE